MKSIYKLIIPVLIVFFIAVAVVILERNNILPSGNIISHDKDDEENDNGIPSRNSTVELMSGKLVVHIPEAIQKQANLELTQLTETVHYNELHASARVVDIQPLLQLRSSYMEIQTKITTAEAALQVSTQEYDRLKLLRKEASNISERQLQQARLDWMSSQSQLQDARLKKDNIKSQILQSWGPVLSEHVLNDSAIANDLFKRNSVLLLVTMEGDRQLPDNTETIFVNAYNNRKEARIAHYLSPASFADPAVYGQSYFFYTEAFNLPTGINLDAWISDKKNENKGVMIPVDAVIWYVDKPWVYVRTGEEAFVRRQLNEYTVTRDGWFVQSDFKPGEYLVLHGAQMLLSEEFRWSIPDEDDNP